MQTRSTKLRAAIERVGKVRDSTEDLTWAEHAAARLLRADTDPDAVGRALDEAARSIVGSAESAKELLGTPEQWARIERERSEEAGDPLLPPPQRMGIRDAVDTALISIGWVSGLFGIFFLVTATWKVQPSALALPTVLGVGIAGLIFLYHRTIRRFSFALAAAVCAAALLAFAFAAGWAILELREHNTELVSLAWFIPLTAGSCIVAIAWLLWGPQPDPAPDSRSSGFRDSYINPATNKEPGRHAADGTDDAHWLKHFGAALRERGDTSDARVHEIVAEARSHGLESSSPLVDEFGPADTAARRYPTGGTVRPRRFALFWAALTVFPAFQITRSVMDQGWGFTWDLALPALWLAAVLLCLAQAVRDWRRAASARTAQRAGNTRLTSSS
jgi:hypothetical protein